MLGACPDAATPGAEPDVLTTEPELPDAGPEPLPAAVVLPVPAAVALPDVEAELLPPFEPPLVVAAGETPPLAPADPLVPVAGQPG